MKHWISTAVGAAILAGGGCAGSFDNPVGSRYSQFDEMTSVSTDGVHLGRLSEGSATFYRARLDRRQLSGVQAVSIRGRLSGTDDPISVGSAILSIDGSLHRLEADHGQTDLSVSQYGANWSENVWAVLPSDVLTRIKQAQSIKLRLIGREYYVGDFVFTDEQVTAVKEYLAEAGY